MSAADTVPKDLRNLRACLMCSLVKSFNQFEMDGCDNCDRYLQMKGDSDRVYDCTSTNFDGIICMMHPEESWVAKWQKLQRKVKGIYAVSVTGTLPDHMEEDIRHQGIPYRAHQRDMTMGSK